VADGRALPFRDASWPAVMLDPPYSDQYARNLYGVENPRPSWLLKEAARVVQPGGRVGILHVAVPFAPPGCRLVKVYGVSTGVGFRIRALTIFMKDQNGLF
jgi:ubiquinone/menaquinone biosynthesis C-methylase UbiE